MRTVDALAIALVVAGAGAFALAGAAFARADDLSAFYWLLVAPVSLRGAAALCRQGATA